MKTRIKKHAGNDNIGNENGRCIYWNVARTERIEINFKAGEMHGPWIHYIGNSGQKLFERHYRNNVPHGLCIEWHENGQKKSKCSYVHGKRNGLSIGWYENGNKKYEIQYKNDIEEGSQIHWRENGRKMMKGRCRNDVPVGPWAIWDENGNLVEEIPARENSLNIRFEFKGGILMSHKIIVILALSLLFCCTIDRKVPRGIAGICFGDSWQKVIDQCVNKLGGNLDSFSTKNASAIINWPDSLTVGGAGFRSIDIRFANLKVISMELWVVDNSGTFSESNKKTDASYNLFYSNLINKYGNPSNEIISYDTTIIPLDNYAIVTNKIEHVWNFPHMIDIHIYYSFGDRVRHSYYVLYIKNEKNTTENKNNNY